MAGRARAIAPLPSLGDSAFAFAFGWTALCALWVAGDQISNYFFTFLNESN